MRRKHFIKEYFRLFSKTTMRNVIPVLLMAVAGFSTASAQSYAPANPYIKKLPATAGKILKSRKQGKEILPAIKMQGVSASSIMKPGYAIKANRDGDAWKDYAKYTFSYDRQGHTVSELAENLDLTQTNYYTYSLAEYTYDESGRPTQVNVKGGFDLNDMQLVYTAKIEYDEVRPDVVISQEAYDIDSDGTKSMNEDSYKQVIERDANGNITAVHSFTWYNNDWLEVQQLETTYGNDGKPTTITQSVATQKSATDQIELTVNEAYADCTWQQANGQIAYVDEIMSGNNLITSAKVNMTSQSDIAMTVEYPETDFDYVMTSEYNYLTLFPTKSVTSFKDFGDKGSYSKTVVDQDLTSAGAYPVQSINQILYTYDDYGNLLEAQDQTYYGHTIINSWEKGTVENDPATGYPATYIHSTYKLQEGNDYYGSWEDDSRVTYGGWLDVSSTDIKHIDGETDGETEYYNLSGMKIKNPASGIYIRKQGKNISKVTIK